MGLPMSPSNRQKTSMRSWRRLTLLTAIAATLTGIGIVARALSNGGVGDVGSSDSGALSYSAVQGQVKANRLVMIRWGWTSGGGHMLVLRGYNTSGSQVSYVNPLLSGYQSDAYTFMVKSSRHTWANSRYNIS